MGAKTLPFLYFLAPSIPRSWLHHYPTKALSTGSHMTAKVLASHYTSTAHRFAQTATAAIEPTDGDLPVGTGQNEASRTALDRSTPSTPPSKISRDEAGPKRGDDRQFKSDFERMMDPLSDPRTIMKEQHRRLKNEKDSLIRKMQIPPREATNDVPPAQQDYKDLSNYLGMDRRTITEPQKRTIRSSPTVGTTIELNPDRRVDFARGLTKLNQQLRANDVRNQARAQKYQERAGQKRKRLRRERWRRFFGSGFKAAVNRVHTMKAQGW